MQSATRGAGGGAAGQKLRVLFLCTGNSARSQIAEAFANELAGDRVQAWSAGTRPKGMDPRVVRVMAEVGIDVSAQRSKSIDEVRDVPFDLVVTVCDAARESCPVFPARARQVHAGFDDPPRLAATARDEAEALSIYRRIRDELRAFVERLPAELEGERSGR